MHLRLPRLFLLLPILPEIQPCTSASITDVLRQIRVAVFGWGENAGLKRQHSSLDVLFSEVRRGIIIVQGDL